MHDLAGRIGFWAFEENRSEPLFIKVKNPNRGTPDDPVKINCRQYLGIKPFIEPAIVRLNDKIPPKAVLKEFAKSVFVGSPFVFENAPKIPTKVLNIICEYLFLEITKNKLQQTPARIANFQRFLVAECVPSHTVESVVRRIARRRECNMQEWLLGSKELRERVLSYLPMDRRNCESRFWKQCGSTKRLPS